jgi:rRNA maturation RNase YbeY
MIHIYVKKQSNYPIHAPSIKKRLSSFFASHGLVSDADCSVAFVGKSVMIDLAKKYLGENNGVHNILTFAESDVDRKFVNVESDLINLGEIVVCYPQALEEANKEGKLIEDKIYELVEHGAMHLMGIHHE